MSKKLSLKLPNSLAGKISLILGILFILSLIPLIIIGFYNHPAADDFTYGMLTHLTWESTHSLPEVLKAAVTTSRKFWETYQGPFASAFFMALQPAVISERLYPLTTFIMLGSLIFSTCVFLKVLLQDYYQIKKEYRRIITYTLLLLSIQLLPSAYEAFYWYCGAVHYIFMHSCMLLLFSCMLFWLKAKSKAGKIIYMLCSCILAFVTGGANFVTGLLTVILFIVFAIFCIYYKKRSALWLTIPFVINLISFYFCVTAPGNLVREADNFGLFDPISSIYQAFRYCLTYTGKWNSPFFIAALIFLLPVIWSAVSRIQARFPLPGLVLLCSFCVLSSTFAPNTYALGTAVIYDRTLNIIMMSYYLLAILNLFYLCGWIHNKLNAYSISLYETLLRFYHDMVRKYHKLFLFSVSASLVFMIFCTYHQDLAAKSAIHDLSKGYAQSYHQEVLHRISLLTMEGVDEVWVPNYSVQPHLLFSEAIGDISEDPGNWKNQAVAEWYGKKIVHLSIVY